VALPIAACPGFTRASVAQAEDVTLPPPLADTVWGFNQAFRKTPRTYFHPENTQFASELAICAAQSLLLVLQLLLGAHCLCSLVFSHLQIRLRNNEPIETNSDKHARHCAQHTFNFLT